MELPKFVFCKRTKACSNKCKHCPILHIQQHGDEPMEQEVCPLPHMGDRTGYTYVGDETWVDSIQRLIFPARIMAQEVHTPCMGNTNLSVYPIWVWRVRRKCHSAGITLNNANWGEPLLRLVTSKMQVLARYNPSDPGLAATSLDPTIPDKALRELLSILDLMELSIKYRKEVSNRD